MVWTWPGADGELRPYPRMKGLREGLGLLLFLVSILSCSKDESYSPVTANYCEESHCIVRELAELRFFLYPCPLQTSLISHRAFLLWAQLLNMLRSLAFYTSFLLRDRYQLLKEHKSCKEMPLNSVCWEWGWLRLPLWLLGRVL